MFEFLEPPRPEVVLYRYIVQARGSLLPYPRMELLPSLHRCMLWQPRVYTLACCLGAAVDWASCEGLAAPPVFVSPWALLLSAIMLIRAAQHRINDSDFALPGPIFIFRYFRLFIL